MTGEIQVIFGPMFSGKTTELLRRIRRYTIATRDCIVLKYHRDTRYSEADEAVTHDKQSVCAKPCATLAEMHALVQSFDVVGIDEGQFFPDLLQYADSWANAGKIVIVAALDGTFQRKPFGSVLSLVPLAESVTKLHAVCMMCYHDTPFSRRLTTETEVEVIGGADKYIAVCRSCFHATPRANGLTDAAASSTEPLTPTSKRRRIYAGENSLDDPMPAGF